MTELLKFFDLTPLDAAMIMVCIPLFLLFLRALDKSLIRPFMARLEDRDTLTVGAGSSADATIRDAISFEEQYAKKIAQARSTAVQAKLTVINSARIEAEKFIASAEEQVAKLVSDQRKENSDEIEKQRKILLGQVDELAQSVAQKLVLPRGLAVWALFFISTMLPEFALASSGEAHGYGYLFWYWVNFLIYVAVMYLVLRGMVAKGWVERRERIKNELEAGKRSLAAALKRYDEANDRLHSADQEALELAKTIEQEGIKESAKISADAKEKADKIRSEASQYLALEGKSQKLLMQKEIGEMVLEKAQTILKSSITKETDRQLREGALRGVKNLVTH
jgi:F-type H+-transporting ATPase subunit b